MKTLLVDTDVSVSKYVQAFGNRFNEVATLAISELLIHRDEELEYDLDDDVQTEIVEVLSAIVLELEGTELINNDDLLSEAMDYIYEIFTELRLEIQNSISRTGCNNEFKIRTLGKVEVISCNDKLAFSIKSDFSRRPA